MRKIVLSLAALAVVASQPARAADPSPGFGASLRLAYGIPMGSVANETNGDLSNFLKGSLPIQLDLGYRITPNLAVAAYGQYAFGFAGDANLAGAGNVCSVSGVSCSGHDWRVGVEAFWHFMPGQQLDPWFGVGTGYEWMSFSAEGGGEKADITFHGWEFVNLQLGADYRVAPGFGFGPFVQFSLGQYSSGNATSTTGGSTSGDITNKTTHEWLQIGVRGTFNL